MIGKRLGGFFLSILLFLSGSMGVLAIEQTVVPTAALVHNEIACRAAILVDAASGKVLYEKDADTPLPPASLTKLMTLLLTAEAIESGKLSLDSMLTCSPYAASMRGSRIWLVENEKMSVGDLLKAVALGSANDAAVMLAEGVSGSEEGFVARMNQRAAELGMKDAQFFNASGIDQTGHRMTARDLAILGSALMQHPMLLKYTSTWMDSLREGKTELVNTNRLVRFMKGCNGLKTGTTAEAGYCLVASAERKHLNLIAVILGARSDDDRFALARGLLEYGFSNFAAKPLPSPDPPLPALRVRGGLQQSVPLTVQAPETVLVEVDRGEKFTQKQTLKEDITAPFPKGTVVGSITLLNDGVVLTSYPIVTAEGVEKLTLRDAFAMLFEQLVSMGRKKT